jgi:hypothetical protein
VSNPDPAPQETPSHTANGSVGIDELQSQIEQTRDELAETVDALSAKLDVKTRAKESVARTTTNAVNAVTDERGRPTPQVIVAVSAAVAAALLVAGVTTWRRRR